MSPARVIFPRSRVPECSRIAVYLVIPLFNIILDHVEDIATGRGNGPDSPGCKRKTSAILFKNKHNNNAMDPRRKLYYFVKRDFLEDEIRETKAL